MDPIKKFIVDFLANGNWHSRYLILFMVLALALFIFQVGVFLRSNSNLRKIRNEQKDQIAQLNETSHRLVRRDMELSQALEDLRLMDEAKSHFIAVAAHQLRTPLSGIKWTLDLILKNNFGELTLKQREYLQSAFETQERLITLVNDLLDVSTMEQGGWDFIFKPEDIISLVSESVKNFEMEADSRNIKLNYSYPQDLKLNPVIDWAKIKIVVDNLISNALKYTSNGGNVDVALKAGEKNFEISISDSGIGIPPEQQEEIFSKFHRLPSAIKMSPNGSGLGLFIARSIALRHGGELGVKSEVGQGSNFTLVLPKKFGQALAEAK